MYNRRSGFTLIELSIVLVIIGLVIGGVLTGRDLIIAAQNRLQVSQIEKFDLATTAFKTKYDCIPGDCARATQLNLGTATGLGDNGNGNGVLDVASRTVGNPPAYYESHTFWQHLSTSNLIDGRYTQNAPASPDYGPIPGVETPALKIPMNGNWGNRTGGVVVAHPAMLENFPFKTGWLFATHTNDYESIAGYSGPKAYAIDRKIDDGVPYTGKVRAVESDGQGFCVSGTCTFPLTYAPGTDSTGNSNACVNDAVTPAQYNLTSYEAGDNGCAMLTQTNW